MAVTLRQMCDYCNKSAQFSRQEPVGWACEWCILLMPDRDEGWKSMFVVENDWSEVQPMEGYQVQPSKVFAEAV